MIRTVHKHLAADGLLTGVKWLRFLERVDSKLKKKKIASEQQKSATGATSAPLPSWCHDIQGELEFEDRPLWLIQIEQLLLIPGVSHFLLSHLFVQPQLAHLLQFLLTVRHSGAHDDPSSSVGEEEEEDRFSSRLDSHYISTSTSKILEHIVPVGKRRIALNMEQKMKEREQEILHFTSQLIHPEGSGKTADSFIAMLLGATHSYGHQFQQVAIALSTLFYGTNVSCFSMPVNSLPQFEQDLVLASRICAGCFRNFVIIHLCRMHREKGDQQGFSLMEDPDFPLILQHLACISTTVSVIMQEKHKLVDLHERMKQLSIIEQTEALLHHHLVKKSELCTTTIEHWMKQLHSMLLTAFKMYKLFTAKTRKALDTHGISVEQLLKQQMEMIISHRLDLLTRKSTTRTKIFTGKKISAKPTTQQEVPSQKEEREAENVQIFSNIIECDYSLYSPTVKPIPLIYPPIHRVEPNLSK